MKKIFTLIVLGLMTFFSNAQYPNSNRPSRTNNLHRSFAVSANLLNNLNYVELLQTGRIRNSSVYHHDKAMAIMQRLDSYLYQEYDALNSQWVNSSRDEFTYDPNGNNTSDIYSSWNPGTAMFEWEDKQEFSYNANGELISETYASWDITSSQWVYSSKWDFMYNSFGDPELEFFYVWDESLIEWILMGKMEFTYNDNRNIILTSFYIYNPLTSQWMNSSRIENAYNAAGYISVSTQSIWNMISSQWENNSKTEYEYNSGGSLSFETSFLWDGVSNQWMNNSKSEYTYNGNGALTLEILYEYSTTNMQWANFEKYEYSFDGNRDMVESRNYFWNGTEWTIIEKDEYTYNTAFTYNQLILPWYYSQVSYISQNMLIGSIEFSGSSFNPVSKSLYNYTPVEFTGIGDNTARRATIFPQPAMDQVTFSWENTNKFLDLRVYDVNQRIVLEQPIENNGIVSTAELASGMYFYRLSGKNNTMFSGKLSIR